PLGIFWISPPAFRNAAICAARDWLVSLAGSGLRLADEVLLAIVLSFPLVNRTGHYTDFVGERSIIRSAAHAASAFGGVRGQCYPCGTPGHGLHSKVRRGELPRLDRWRIAHAEPLPARYAWRRCVVRVIDGVRADRTLPERAGAGQRRGSRRWAGVSLEPGVSARWQADAGHRTAGSTAPGRSRWRAVRTAGRRAGGVRQRSGRFAGCATVTGFRAGSAGLSQLCRGRERWPGGNGRGTRKTECRPGAPGRFRGDLPPAAETVHGSSLRFAA